MEKKISKGEKRDIVENINEKDGTFKFKHENEYMKIIKRFKIVTYYCNVTIFLLWNNFSCDFYKKIIYLLSIK